MKWRSRKRKGGPRSDSVRTPAEIIDDLMATVVAEQRAEVTNREASVVFARRRLADAEADQLTWRRDGTFDHVLGVRALLMAQIADLDRCTQPPGANLAGMLAFLNEHHSPLLPLVDSAGGAPDLGDETAGRDDQ